MPSIIGCARANGDLIWKTGYFELGANCAGVNAEIWLQRDASPGVPRPPRVPANGENRPVNCSARPPRRSKNQPLGPFGQRAAAGAPARCATGARQRPGARRARAGTVESRGATPRAACMLPSPAARRGLRAVGHVGRRTFGLQSGRARPPRPRTARRARRAAGRSGRRGVDARRAPRSARRRRAAPTGVAPTESNPPLSHTRWALGALPPPGRGVRSTRGEEKGDRVEMAKRDLKLPWRGGGDLYIAIDGSASALSLRSPRLLRKNNSRNNKVKDRRCFTRTIEAAGPRQL